MTSWSAHANKVNPINAGPVEMSNALIPGSIENAHLSKQELAIVSSLSGKKQENYVHMHTLREQDLFIDSNNKYMTQAMYGSIDLSK
jgi:hypothetical protein